MDIIRGTTPTIQYTFSVVPVADITTAILTIKRGNVVAVEKQLADATVGEDTLSWKLTQEETLMVSGTASIMLNWKLRDGTRGASKERTVVFDQNHVNEVI